MTDLRDINHGHIFCGLGGGAKGFNAGEARVGSMVGRFVCKGGIDVDPAACRDFERLAGVPADCMDLFSREQYAAFHGHEPPPGWAERTPADIRAVFRDHLHILFLSAPCKGFSGLLAEAKSKSAKYAALNGLTLRGVWLVLEAFAGDPVELIVFENVPRIATRGRHLLDQIVALLRAYGYQVAETKHDCGEIGGLAQSRKRFLLVARHAERVPPFLYEPPRRRLRGVGEVIGRLPVPGPWSGPGMGPDAALPMHRMPSLQWKTWVRLAFVEAGSDWRSLNRLAVADGNLRDFGIAPVGGPHNGAYGVHRWQDPAGTVTSNGRPASGAFSVADPRAPGTFAGKGKYPVAPFDAPAGTVIGASTTGHGAFAVADPRAAAFSGAYGVRRWDESSGTVAGESLPPNGAFSVADPRAPDVSADRGGCGVSDWGQPAPTVTSQRSPGQGRFAVADPRIVGARFNNLFRIVDWSETSPAVAGPGGSGGGLAVSDPRTGWNGAHESKLAVRGWDQPAKTVTGSDRVGSGAMSVADPRPRGLNASRDHYQSGGHYGVVPWGEPAHAVPGYAKYDRGNWSVADPRPGELPAQEESGGTTMAAADVLAGLQQDPAHLPAPEDRLVAVIRALDGTWHRPFTTLELAALQGLVDADETLELEGQSDSAWRERIGNAVPPPAARAIAGVMGRTLLLAWSGETFMLSAEPIWVRDVAVALAVDQAGVAG